MSNLDFSTYQVLSRKTAIYPNSGNNYIYPALGLGGESGEVLEKVKKLIRDKNSQVTDEFRQVISKELGDVLWYVAQLCTEFRLDMGEVAKSNIDKLLDRMNRDVLKGSGDNR